MARRRVLLVDDEPGVTRPLQRFLEQKGLEVRALNDSEGALDELRRFRPDILFLDIQMPGLDGPRLAGRIKDEPELKDLVVVFLTGMVQESEVGTEGKRIGGNLVLAKPVTPTQVLDCIRKLLGDGPPGPS